MNDAVTVTILVENSVNIAGLRAEHGCSVLIRHGARKLLFDTGQSDLVLHNARRMGLVLDDLEAVVLSHGHYDHTGGIADLATSPHTKIYAHPSAFTPKFVGNPDGTTRFIGLAPGSLQALRSVQNRVVWTSNPTEVLPGFFVTGEIPRTNQFEDTGGRFFLDAGCRRPDPLLDDQALYFETQRGLVVILGCAHAGVVNTLEYIRALTGNRPIHTIIGGMHLGSTGPERIEATLEAFRSWAPKHLAPGHCTGIQAITQIMSAFPGRCTTCPVGTSWSFPAPLPESPDSPLAHKPTVTAGFAPRLT